MKKKEITTMKNNKNTMPEIWRTMLVDQENLSQYSWDEDKNGHYVIEVKDYSDLNNIKTVRTIRCKSFTKPCHWSWLRK
jgi:hypothetical protein